MTPPSAARNAPSAKTPIETVGTRMPTPCAISASSTAARIIAPTRVRSSASHSAAPDERGQSQDEEPIARKAQLADREHARERGGQRERVGIAAPDQQGQILKDEREADRHQHLAEGLVGQAAQEEPLHADADERDRHRPAQQGQGKLPVRQITERPM